MSTSTVQTLVNGKPVPIKGLYYDKARDRWYTRPKRANGTRGEHTLDARSQGEAIKEFSRIDKTPAVTTVKQLIQAYLDAGTPGAKRRVAAKKGKYAQAERSRCASLLAFFGTMKAADAQIGHCMDYAKWRLKRIKKKGATGGTTVDLDLVTLSNVFRYGTLHGSPKLVASNPFMEGRPVFAEKSVPCREKCCRSGDELHRVAAVLNGVVRLQFLFENCSGCRTGEAVPLRRDAEEGMPGFIRTEDGERYLCIARLKQGDEDPYDYIHVNPALALVLRDMEAWHAKLKVPSQWFFPGRERAADQHIDEGALGHALKRKAVTKLLPTGRLALTPHGCRAFYVTWRRAQGIPLQQIATEVGQRSGVKLIEDVYGRNLPTWAAKNFSPFPKTVAAVWGAGNEKVSKNGDGASTIFTTSFVGKPHTRFDTREHQVIFQTSAMVFTDSDLQHTMTR